MDMEHRVWSGAIQTLEKRPPGTCAYVLLLSHFAQVLKMPEKQGQIHRLQVEQQIFAWNARSRV